MSAAGISRLPVSVHHAYWLRRLAYLGARYGSDGFLKHGSSAFGAAFAQFLPGHRQIVRDNLRRIHGTKSTWLEHREVTETFVNYARCLTEALGIERRQPGDIQYEVSGQETLDLLLKRPAGFIVATAHVGAWDCAALHLQQSTSRPVIVVMERESNAAARAFQDSIRQRVGVEVIHVGDDAFEGLRLLKHLRRGGIVAVQLDRRPKGGRTVNATLFGKAFQAPLGPFQLASLASVPILPVFCARIGFYRYQIRVTTQISLIRRASGPELQAAAQEAISSLEDFLRIYPTQWFHFEHTDNPP